MKKFNINDEWYIQIKENGWKHLKETVSEEYITQSIETRKHTIDGIIYHKLQCHQVFSLFPIDSSFDTYFIPTILMDDSVLVNFNSKMEIIFKYVDNYSYTINVEKFKTLNNKEGIIDMLKSFGCTATQYSIIDDENWETVYDKVIDCCL